MTPPDRLPERRAGRRARPPYQGALGAVLAAGATFGAIEVLLLPTPPSVLPWLIASTAAMSAASLLWIFQTATRPRVARAAFLAVFYALGVVIVALMAWTDGRTAWVIMLLLPIVGGIEFRRAGAAIGTVVGVPGILLNAVLADVVWGLDPDPFGVAGEVATMLGVGWLCMIWASRTEYFRERALARQAAEADERLHEEVAQRDRALDELRGSVIDVTTQPFRQPLRAVHDVTVGMLHPALADDAAREALDTIQQQANELNALAADLKTLHDLDADRISVRPVPAALRPLVRRACASVVDGGRAAMTGDDATVLVDPEAFVRALGHVVDNALRHGARRADVHWNRRAGAVDVVVSDDGPGIHPDDADRVFGPFVQLGTARDAHPGRGLGLTLARGLLRAMGGEVAVEPSGVGTRVRMRVPLAVDTAWQAPRGLADDDAG